MPGTSRTGAGVVPERPRLRVSTELIPESAVMKNNSWPCGPQTGKSPPRLVIRRLPSAVAGTPKNGRTYTSGRPVSFETYAIHFPSGEKRPPNSTNDVARKGIGFSPVPTRCIQISPSPSRRSTGRRVSNPRAMNAVRHELLCGSDVDASLEIGRPRVLPSRSETKINSFPLADQTGNQSLALLRVTREVIPRAMSMYQISRFPLRSSGFEYATRSPDGDKRTWT